MRVSAGSPAGYAGDALIDGSAVVRASKLAQLVFVPSGTAARERSSECKRQTDQ